MRHEEVLAWKRTRDKAIAENARLRELYENVTGNRERFGWTIDHLLECEEALRTVEVAADEAIAERDALREALRFIARMDPVDAALDPHRAVRVAEEALREGVLNERSGPKP